MNKIIKSLESQIKSCKRSKLDLDDASWGYETGVLLSANDAQKILDKLSDQVHVKVKQLPITKDLTKEASEILKLPAMRVGVPEWMKKQKILVEWARKTATLIINNTK